MSKNGIGGCVVVLTRVAGVDVLFGFGASSAKHPTSPGRPLGLERVALVDGTSREGQSVIGGYCATRHVLS